MRNFFVRGVLSALVISSGFAFAEGSTNEGLDGRLDHHDHNSQCSSYDYRPDWCQRTPGCEYDWRSNTCNGGGGGGGSSCERFNGNAQWCQQTPGCEYDYRYDECIDSGNVPPPGDQCWQYNQNPNLCNRVLNCYFDYRISECVSRGINPPPPPFEQHATISCSSSGYSYNVCSVPGQVIRANLIHQSSGAACVYGQTWGYSAQGIWVDRGCRGEFDVAYRY